MTAAVRYWLPLAMWMAAIYVLSDRADIPGVQHGLLDLVLKKSLHAAGYGVLAWLWWRALDSAGVRQAIPWALALTVAYAVTDEWHQSTVEGRTGRATDVLIDALGATVALLIVRRHASGKRPSGYLG